MSIAARWPMNTPIGFLVFCVKLLLLLSPIGDAGIVTQSSRYNEISRDKNESLIDQTGNKTYCAHDGKTYYSTKDARSFGDGVMHCDACGACSNYVDITIYEETSQTLTPLSAICAAFNILGRDWGRNCFARMIGFTVPCEECWLDNFRCTQQNCLLICIRELIIGGLFGGDNNEDDESLSACLQCDEDLCGPAFKECAGATRRRAGIITDIDRPDSDFCGGIIDPWPIEVPNTDVGIRKN